MMCITAHDTAMEVIRLLQQHVKDLQIANKKLRQENEELEAEIRSISLDLSNEYSYVGDID